MYKITLYDWNLCPIGDGTTCFFAEDIEEFQRRWLGTGRVPEDLEERFLRSKKGEPVTDWWNDDDPELRIVQEDEAAVCGEKTRVLRHKTFDAHNAYYWPTRFHVNRWTIRFQWIRFKEAYYRIAAYQAEGVSHYGMFTDRLQAVHCFGNPVLENTIKYDPHYPCREDPAAWDDPGFNDFAENRIETICWLTNAVFENEEDLNRDMAKFRVTKKVMDRLFADVVGEC